MYLYITGNQSFQVATQHASLREEALLCLETVSRDLDQLMVSDQKNQTTGNFYLVEPYQLDKMVNQTGVDPNDGQKKTYPVASQLTFYRYHHTGTNPNSDPAFPTPALFADKIVYTTQPCPNDPKHVNLLRQGQIINRIPLTAVMFETLNPVLAADNIGGAPQAILKVTIVPKGGMWGELTPQIIQALRDNGEVLSRVFHLSGYESEYTSYLSLALAKIRRVNQNATPPISPADIQTAQAAQKDPLTDVEAALITHASMLPGQQFANVFKKLATSPAMNYAMPASSVIIEPNTNFVDSSAAADVQFANKAAKPGAEPIIGSGTGGAGGGGGSAGGSHGGSAH